MGKLSTRTQAPSILSSYILHIANAGVASYKTTLSFLMDFIELNKNSYAKNITAFATGGQASATQLTKRRNRIDTVATSLDSVKLPQIVAGMEVEVYNNGANDLNLYPFLADKFLGSTANTPIVLVPGQSIKVFAYELLTWTI